MAGWFGEVHYSLLPHDVISCHWAPSWLFTLLFRFTATYLIHLTISSYVLAKYEWQFQASGSIGPEKANTYFVVAMCFENKMASMKRPIGWLLHYTKTLLQICINIKKMEQRVFPSFQTIFRLAMMRHSQFSGFLWRHIFECGSL